MTKTLATYAAKGGVGKTAAAVNLAFQASATGASTLLWDLDPQGAATFTFRIKPRVKGGVDGLLRHRRELEDVVKGTDFDGLDLVPSDFSYRNLDVALDDFERPRRELRRLIKPVRADYDVVVLDCPPSLSLATEAVFEAADALIVPLVPTTLSARTYAQLLRFLDDAELKRRPRVLGFFSMVDRRRKLHRELVEELREQYPDLLETSIPFSTDVERMSAKRAPLGAWAPKSTAGKAYRSLWAEITERL